MAQIFSYVCPRCGIEVAANQRFCARCGLDMTSGFPGSAPQQAVPPVPQQAPFQAAPPVPQAFPVPQQAFPAPQQPVSGMPPFEPGQPVRKSGMSRLVVVALLLLVIVILGGASYAGIQFFGLGKPVQAAITTIPIQTKFTYAGVDITLLNAQQAQNFIDDPNTTTTGMVRIHIQGQNKTAVPVNLIYSTIAHLILPGGKVVEPVYVKAVPGIIPGATQTGTIDFPVPSNVKVEQVMLRMGASNEAQMDIPLKGNADVGQYAPRTVNLTGKLQYLGLDWTLVSATSQLSIDGKQASKGMHYVTITLKVDSTLAQTAIPGSAYDYIRLKAGDTIATPKDTTLPVSFDAGETGKTGTVTFLVPQNITTLTLILAPQNKGGFDQATKNFQL